MPDRLPRVLVAEDELLVAMDTEFMLEQCGCAIVGPAASVEKALALIRADCPDAAVLDVNLAGRRVWPVAEFLREAGVPFVLVTGYGSSEVRDDFRSRPILAKPTSLAALGEALRALRVIPA